jgi:hypothetical protein
MWSTLSVDCQCAPAISRDWWFNHIDRRKLAYVEARTLAGWLYAKNGVLQEMSASRRAAPPVSERVEPTMVNRGASMASLISLQCG